ncbi:MAG: ATP-dependent DNA helicase, partial [Alphaproteobacteria bacterium]|nr:ATP-dependent DNA helicase [Alphaproteobacteria bacterium]
GEGWQARLRESASRGPTERFLARVRDQVLARSTDGSSEFGLECPTDEPGAPLLEAAAALARALDDLGRALEELIAAITARLDDRAVDLDGPTRLRLDAARRGLAWRLATVKQGWRPMLADLRAGTPPDRVDWFGLEREAGREVDVGLYRHLVDPTRAFAGAVLSRAHGAIVTSATLRDRDPKLPEAEREDWRAAELRTGAHHLPLPAKRVSVASPFDYAARARVFVVTDVPGDKPDLVAQAYRELFLAAGGGALGLFTAIRRLRAVHQAIAKPLEAAGLPLYAQHVDPLDVGTLVDIFRAETESCLLGTDAVRDGVDVPGKSLRLIVFDRVPWPRPDLLHKARRKAFGGKAWDDRLVRLRLSQAFGRLIRRKDDAGVFVMLDRRLPSRLLGAFPPAVPVARVDLKTALAETRAFLGGHFPGLPAPPGSA